MRTKKLGPMLFLTCCAFVPLGCDANHGAQMPPTITTKLGVEMVLIPAGSFEMGNNQGHEDERPVHKVRIDSFLMDKYEVTQALFDKVGKDAEEPFSSRSHFEGADLPAEQVTWRQAALFCNARSIQEGLKPCYSDECVCDFGADGYRLPTEAEWEYACRAGTASAYSFGNEAKQLGEHGWFVDNADNKTHPVGKREPNPWGLYDMHGNVAEWCQDVYDKGYYRASPDQNPRGPDGVKEYVLRGGSWKSNADALQSSYRLGAPPGFSDACLAQDAIGFRCVRKAPAAEK